MLFFNQKHFALHFYKNQLFKKPLAETNLAMISGIFFTISTVRNCWMTMSQELSYSEDEDSNCGPSVVVSYIKEEPPESQVKP